MGKGTSHIIPLATAGLHQLLEFRDDFVVASVSGIIYTGTVVDLFSSVKGEYDVTHFFVGKFNDIVINEHTIGG